MLGKSMIALALLGVAATAPAAEQRRQTPTERQAKELATALDGKTAGTPVTCVSRTIGMDGLRAVTDDLLLYRVNRKLTYRNDLRGSCSGISRGTTLVLQPTNDQYCRGDIAYSVDFTTGMRGPSCVLGSFVPYRAAGE